MDAALMLLSGSCFPDRASATTDTAPLWAVQDDAVPADPALDQPKIASDSTSTAAVHQPEAKGDVLQSGAALAQAGPATTSRERAGAAQIPGASTKGSSSPHPSHSSKPPGADHPPSRNPVDGVDGLRKESSDAAQVRLLPWSETRQQPARRSQSAEDADRWPARKRSQLPTDASRKPVPT